MTRPRARGLFVPKPRIRSHHLRRRMHDLALPSVRVRQRTLAIGGVVTELSHSVPPGLAGSPRYAWQIVEVKRDGPHGEAVASVETLNQ